jgi:hypothetical protein
MSEVTIKAPDAGICTSSAPGIVLTNGQVVIVDPEDFERLRGFTWGINKPGGYAQTGMNGEIVRMHRLIVGAREGEQVDHINGNKLDNRRANLRVCDRGQNEANKPPQRRHGRPYKGVYAWRNRWKAVVAGKHVGLFKTPLEAAKAYDLAAVEKWGPFAATNLPRD